MYKLSTYLVVPSFCYLPVYMLDLVLIELGYQDETKLRIIHNWMVHWWVLVHCGCAESALLANSTVPVIPPLFSLRLRVFYFGSAMFLPA